MEDTENAYNDEAGMAILAQSARKWRRAPGCTPYDPAVPGSGSCHKRGCEYCQSATACRRTAKLLHAVADRIERPIWQVVFQGQPNSDWQLGRIKTMTAFSTKLIRAACWKNDVVGGVRGFHQSAHPHVHAIVEAESLDDEKLTRVWRRAMGESVPPVWTGPINQSRADWFESIAYAVNAGPWRLADDQIAKYVNAVAGSRCYQPFGTWKRIATEVNARARTKAKAQREPEQGLNLDNRSATRQILDDQVMPSQQPHDRRFGPPTPSLPSGGEPIIRCPRVSPEAYPW